MEPRVENRNFYINERMDVINQVPQQMGLEGPELTCHSLSLALGLIGRERRGKLRLSWSSKNGIEKKRIKVHIGNELAFVPAHQGQA